MKLLELKDSIKNLIIEVEDGCYNEQTKSKCFKHRNAS